MWHFRNKTLHESLYHRQDSAEKAINRPEHTDVDDIVNVINQGLSQFSPFDGVAFLGELMGAWMLTCPRELILCGKNETKDWRPNQVWIRSVFPDSLAEDVSADELEILYISDYYLYYAFWDLASYNVYK
jgi:hypothetical protein